MALFPKGLWGGEKEIDFNYPQDVSKNALADLQSALKTHDGELTVDALIRYSIAQSGISNDNLATIIDQIEATIGEEQRPEYKALLYCLEAVVLDNYVDNVRVRTAATVEGEEPSKDYSEWNRDQFRAKIESLLKLAVENREALQQVPVTSLSKIIKCNELGALYVPTLYQFLVAKCREMSQDDAFKSSLRSLYAQSVEDKPEAYIYAVDKSLMGYVNNLEVYNRYIDNEHCGMLLDNFRWSKDGYAITQDYLKRHPRGAYAAQAHNLIQEFERVRVSASTPRDIAPGKKIPVVVRSTNAQLVKLVVYRLPDKLWDDINYSYNDYPREKLIALDSVEVKFDKTIPFSDEKQTIELEGLPCGVYIVAAATQAGGKEVKSRVTHHDVMRVSQLAMTHFKQQGKNEVIVVDRETGAPVEGATVTVTNNSRKTLGTATTGKDGIATLPTTDGYTYFYARKGDDRYCDSMSDRNETYGSNPYYDATVYTDLGIYRPGEKVKWSLVAYSTAEGSRSLLTYRELKVEFEDPNGEKVGSVLVSTDAYGRAQGEFDIPTDRLNGRFTINVRATGNGSRHLTYKTVNVSEYKTPTFAVDYTTQRQAFVAGEPVVIEGNASTYSGMPVAGSEVTLTLKRTQWYWGWRWYMPNERETHMQDFTATTDAQGNFRLEIPADVFPENTDNYGRATYNYALTARVTNAGGESQEATKRFIVGKRAGIEMPDQCTQLVNGPTTLPVTYNTTSETEKSVICSYELLEHGTENIVATGNFDTAEPQVDFTSIPSGEYTIKVHILGTDAYSESNNAEMYLVLYRASDKQAPIKDSPLWLPVTSVEADARGHATFTVGTSSPLAYIYYIVSSHKGVEKTGWLHYTPNLHKFNVYVPARDEESLTVEFVTYYKGTARTASASVLCKARQRAIKVEAASFRDKLTPGDTEKWTFSITDKDGRPVPAAMMLEMMDKALNSLSDNSWSLSVPLRFNRKYTVYTQNLGYTSSTDLQWQGKSKNVASLVIPHLNLYDQEMFSYMSRYYKNANDGGVRLMRSMAVAPSSVMVESDMLKEESVGFNPSDEESAEEAQETKKALDNVSVRMADVKTALWRPMLTTDAQGNVVVEFEAPQFNTTWIVQAVAWDKDLYSSTLSREVLTQKEVMVKSALPRFVRTGDQATLTATVMNATDRAITAQAVIELFDPRTEQVIATRNFTQPLDAHGTAAVSIDWQVPDTLPFVGFRIKAASGRHSDGEQVMLPVLASTQPIIETQPFYIEQGEQSHSVTVPTSARDARVTLEYCDNPTWYCVTALPALFDDNYQVSTRAAHTLFTIDVAQGIAQSNPKIKEAVDHWNDHPEDSVLVSMLAKNQDLKIGSLLASPWLRESERQTLRMSQIGRLLDKQEMQAERKKVVDALLDNQMVDGGWCWFKHPMATSSVYTTHTVLELIGEIKHLGYLPQDERLDEAVKRAVAYYDNEWLRIYRERKDKKNYDGFDDFVYVRTLYSDIAMKNDVKKLFDGSLRAMKKNWSKGLSLASKAYFALTLERNGDHKTAAAITESIRQHAITKPELGMYWDNLQSGWRYFDKVAVTSVILQALNEVDHRQAEIDLVRKWMLLMKQTNDWGSSSLAADAVYSLLSTGTDWLQAASQVNITVDGQPLDIADAEKYLGYVRRTINVEPGAVINIARNGKSPAWGAVYCQFRAQMSETQQVAIDELSIHKEYYIYSTDGKLTPATSLHVGDKVQVRTVIKCNRDLDFVTVVDERASCFEPVDQLSGYRRGDGSWYYLETKDSKTNIFFHSLDKGTHIISYDVNVTAPGRYNAGVASAQCQYAPQIAAHSSGTLIEVK